MILLAAALYFHGVPAGATLNDALHQLATDFPSLNTLCRDDVCSRRLPSAWPAGDYPGPVDLLCHVLPEVHLVFSFAHANTLTIEAGSPTELYELCHLDAWGAPLHIHPPCWEEKPTCRRS